MSKLFIAANLPTGAASPLRALVGAQPGPAVGIRLTQPEQMHITLHYIGEADVGRVSGALQRFVVASFPLTISGVGEFVGNDGTATLWARVAPSEALSAVHAALADALAPTGFRPETRQYTPHVSLARCEPSVLKAVREDFLANGAGLRHDGIIDSIGLFSSSFEAGSPRYTCEARFEAGLARGAG